MRDIHQLQSCRADARKQRGDAAFIRHELDAFRQLAGEFEEGILLHAMPPEAGRCTIRRTAGNAEFAGLFEQRFMQRSMRMFAAFLGKESNTKRLHGGLTPATV